MNPLIRHFLPSLLRGVYRFDHAFGSVTDDDSYSQFIENKFHFLPHSLIISIKEAVKVAVKVAGNREETTAQISLETPRGAKTRADNFLLAKPYFQQPDQYLEKKFVKNILAPILSDYGMTQVTPQQPIGKFFADFTIEFSGSKLALEVDGFGKFKDRDSLDQFLDRQNCIVSEGWRILRYTYSQITGKNNCAAITRRRLHDFLAADPNLRRLLADQTNLLSVPEYRENVIDLVNDYYRIQDWFVEHCLRNGSGQGATLLITDNTEYPFPIVLLSLIFLYHFLDSIEKIIDIKFDLPHVKLCGSTVSHPWKSSFDHAAIICTKTRNRKAISLQRSDLMFCGASIPVPTNLTTSFSYRRNQEETDIHEHLEFITREIFGYGEGAKPFQKKILQRLFNGKDTLGISTTGSGKSFCFWLPSLLKPGLTIVVAPLRSLMRDQKLTLHNYGMASIEFINSDISQKDRKRYLQEVKLGYIRLLYIAPERLRMKDFVTELNTLQEYTTVNLLAIDEAHCISEWGHDFRPSYLKLPNMRETIAKSSPNVSLLALTATAGPQVETDMRWILKLSSDDVVR